MRAQPRRTYPDGAGATGAARDGRASAIGPITPISGDVSGVSCRRGRATSTDQGPGSLRKGGAARDDARAARPAWPSRVAGVPSLVAVWLCPAPCPVTTRTWSSTGRRCRGKTPLGG